MININQSVITKFNENHFIYFGVRLDASTDTKGKIIKEPIHPKGYNQINAPLIKPIYNKETKKEDIDPNGIMILTDKSNLSIIDVDIPEECPILDKLLVDCKWIHKTRKGYHFLFKKNDLERKKRCKVIDVNVDIYFINEYKHIETNEVIGRYEIIKAEKIIDMPKYAYDYCDEMIKTHNMECIKTGGRSISKIAKKKKDSPSPENNNKLNLDIMNEFYKIHFDAGSFKGFDDWFKLAYCGRHLNNTQEGYELFLKYSRKVKGYENEAEEHIKSHFYNGTYIENFDEIGCLLQVRKISKKKFLKFIDPLLKSSNVLPSKHFDRKYIYPNETDLDYKDEIQKYNDFIDKQNPLKLMAISSAYGTGKTHTFKKLINNFDSVLFLTYRQSLANSLYTELKEEYGFDNYKELSNDELRQSERLIIQMDSLPRLQGEKDYITGQKSEIKEYDLIVLDECEGLLSHFNAKTLTEKEYTFGLLTELCDRANKIFVCDGDLAERSFDFIDKTLNCQYKIYVNDYKPIEREIVFVRDQELFHNKIETALKNNKKIVICCMLASETMKFKAMFEKDYNVLVHNGSEKNKEKLIHYKEEWKKVDLLIYSPTIEAGVDFDIEHFDLCFGSMSDKSTSARAFSQMLHRVRKFNENQMMIYIGNLNYHENDFLYYPKTIDNYYFKNYDTIKGLENIQLHNKVEELNTLNYVVSDFIRIIQRKGYKFQFLDKIKKAKEVDYETRKEGICKVGLLNSFEYLELVEKQNKSEELTQEEVYHLDKYFMSLKFYKPIEEIDEDFIKTHFRKDYIIDNYNAIIGDGNEENPFPDKSMDNNFISDKIDVWNPIFKLLKQPMKKSDVENELNSIINIKKTKQLFSTLPNTETSRKLIDNINNHILNEIGCSIVQTSKRYKDEGKRKEFKILSLEQGEILKGYLERSKNCNQECLIDENAGTHEK